MKKELPLSLKLIRGAIGKEFVIKHYKDGAVRTNFPDMSGIVASPRQRKCRNLFKDAVAYAKEVIADAERKSTWQKKLRKRHAVYNAAIREYLLRDKKAKQMDLLVTNRLLRNAMLNTRCVNSSYINDGKEVDNWLSKSNCYPLTVNTCKTAGLEPGRLLKLNFVAKPPSTNSG